MPEARVIPIDGGDRPKRRPARSASDAVAAGAARATGERSRRRTSSPLLDPDAKPPAERRSRAASAKPRTRKVAKAGGTAGSGAGAEPPAAEVFDELSAAIETGR